MKGNFEGATKFYEQVILKDSAWSAFAHYNRAYCTIQLKDGGYISRAIDDLKTTLCKLEIHKNKLLFSKVFKVRKLSYEMNVRDDSTNEENIKFSEYYITMGCQLLNHIDTQIIKTIEKLETNDTEEEEVRTECRNILDLIPNVDCLTERILEKYRQLGLLFTFNIDGKPTFCYEAKIVSSLVMLESVSDILLMLKFQGTSLNSHSKFETKYINELLCNLGTVNDDSLAWMSRCVVAAVTTGIHSITFMRDVSYLVSFKQSPAESTFKTNSETSEFSQVSCDQTNHWLTLLETTTQGMKKLICRIGDELILNITNVVMSVLVGRIEEIFHEKLKPGQKLHLALCALYGSVTSQSTSNFQLFVDRIQDLAQALAQSSQFSFETVDPTNLVADLVSKYLNVSNTSTDISYVFTENVVTAAEIDINIVISKISDLLADSMHTFIKNIPDVGDIIDDGQMLEATNKVLTSVCSDIIRSMVQSEITQALMLDLRQKTMGSLSSIYEKLSNAKIDFAKERKSKFSNIVSNISSHVRWETRDLLMRSTTESKARLTSQCLQFNITILDANKEVIVTYSSPKNNKNIQLVCYPPCYEYPGGHYDAYNYGEVVQVTHKKIYFEFEDEEEEEDDDLWYSAVAVASKDKTSFIVLER